MVLTDAEVKIKYGIDQRKSVGLPDPSNAAGTTREIFNETMNSIENKVVTSALLDAR
jgi:hypothetical protein